MSLFTRFHGTIEADDSSNRGLVANVSLSQNLSLQVIFPGLYRFGGAELEASLGDLYPKLSTVQCEFDPVLQEMGEVFGLIGWDDHVIQCVGHSKEIPEEEMKSWLKPSPYDDDIKKRVWHHKSYVELRYAGVHEDPVIQYASLLMISVALRPLGGLVVANPLGKTSLPLDHFYKHRGIYDLAEAFHSMALLVLYCGMVKHELQGIEAMLMRTYGAEVFGLPNLAAYADGHGATEACYEVFAAMLSHFRSHGRRPKAGDHFYFDDGRVEVDLREPFETEWYLHEDTGVLVVNNRSNHSSGASETL